MQTSLEYLIQKLAEHQIYRVEMNHIFSHYVDIAFQKEREQILLAWENGALPEFLKENKCSRDYFEKTYKKHGHETF